MNDSDLCHAHRNMTPELYKERWFQFYILGQRPNNQVLFRANPTIRNKTLKTRILTPLLSGDIKLTAKDLAAIPPRDRFIDIFVLLLENGFADEKNNTKLMVRIFMYYVRYHLIREDLRAIRSNALNALITIIERLIKTRARTLASFVYTLPDVLTNLPDYYNTEAIFCPMLLELMDSDAAKELCWYPKTGEIIKRYEKTDIGKGYLSFLQGRWLPDLRELYQTEKQIQKAKMDYVKEELMMNRWHPDRLWHYINMGLDPDDM